MVDAGEVRLGLGEDYKGIEDIVKGLKALDGRWDYIRWRVFRPSNDKVSCGSGGGFQPDGLAEKLRGYNVFELRLFSGRVKNSYRFKLSNGRDTHYTCTVHTTEKVPEPSY